MKVIPLRPNVLNGMLPLELLRTITFYEFPIDLVHAMSIAFHDARKHNVEWLRRVPNLGYRINPMVKLVSENL